MKHSSSTTVMFVVSITAASLISDDSKAAYGVEVHNFVKWCSKINLVLNTTRTKEITADFRKTRRSTHCPAHTGRRGWTPRHLVKRVQQTREGAPSTTTLDKLQRTLEIYTKWWKRLSEPSRPSCLSLNCPERGTGESRQELIGYRTSSSPGAHCTFHHFVFILLEATIGLLPIQIFLYPSLNHSNVIVLIIILMKYPPHSPQGLSFNKH